MSNFCPKCGKPYYDEGNSTIPPELCKCNQGLMGWICPICGRGNSPHTSTCPCQPFQPTCLGGING
jgi:hypothetical protein